MKKFLAHRFGKFSPFEFLKFEVVSKIHNHLYSTMAYIVVTSFQTTVSEDPVQNSSKIRFRVLTHQLKREKKTQKSQNLWHFGFSHLASSLRIVDCGQVSPPFICFRLSKVAILERILNLKVGIRLNRNKYYYLVRMYIVYALRGYPGPFISSLLLVRIQRLCVLFFLCFGKLWTWLHNIKSGCGTYKIQNHIYPNRELGKQSCS